MNPGSLRASLLCDVVSFPPVPRFRERPMFPHSALPCVASFPPAALPAFTGTTRLSDSLRLICLPPSSAVRHTLCFERGAGPPGLPCNHNVKHAMVSDPEEADITLPLAAMTVLTSTSITVSSFPTRQLRGSIPSTFRLMAYLLAILRLKLYVTIQPPRTRYPVTGLPSGAGGGHTRLTTRPCPAAQSIWPLFHLMGRHRIARLSGPRTASGKSPPAGNGV